MSYLDATAKISACGKFRYELTRRWALGSREPFVLWCMLNPSTADGSVDDPTIRKCVGFSRLWGFGSLVVVNMFAYRATDPQDLKKAGYLCGPENHLVIREYAEKAGLIVVAWGNHAPDSDIQPTVDMLTFSRAAGQNWFGPLKCLGRTKSGQPRHPLMVSYDTPLEDYS